MPKVKLSNDKLIAAPGEDILVCNVYKRTNLAIPESKSKFKYIHLLKLIEKEYCNHSFLGNLQFSTKDVIDMCMEDFDINHMDMIDNKTNLRQSISAMLISLKNLGYIELLRDRIIIDATNKVKRTRQRKPKTQSNETQKRKRTKYSYSDTVMNARQERKNQLELNKEHKLKVQEMDRVWKEEQLIEQQKLEQYKLQNKIH